MEPDSLRVRKLERGLLAVLVRRARPSDPELWPRAVVLVRAEGDDGVEPVVAAAELHDHEDPLVGNAGVRREKRVPEHAHRAPLDEAGHGRRERREGEASLEEEAPREWFVRHGVLGEFVSTAGTRA